MSLNSCLVFLSLAIIVSCKISNEGDNTGLEESNLRGCKCDHYNCACCQHLLVKHVHLNDTICANLSYLPDDIGFSLTITFDSYTVFNTTFSARNPPPICIGQDYIKQLEADICLRFYNLDVNKHHFHGCLKFEVEFHRIILASYDLGCLDLGPNNSESNQNIVKSKWGRFWSRNQVPQVVVI